MTDHNTDTEAADDRLTIRRTFDAPRERVYRAFTEPEEVERWFGPRSMTGEVHALEPEPGGAYSVSMLDEENRYDVEGEFLEVVENERLVHTWEPGRVTIEFRDVDEGCEVVLTHEGLPDGESVDDHADGWANALENLAGVL
ncbi:SRPBCC family protein [Natrinema gelatinilyticum]|uniref:SRPBCC family protein n=1 Tax=Natrinema gelatinilyticum TaxID=2961571 RepID=UPI0020C456AA|nr:SRPBCC domain-containing protein [Natrinema gelatinilyticum]